VISPAVRPTASVSRWRSPAANARSVIVLAALVICAAVIRVLAARGDLWLDELWSLSFARQMRGPLEVWTSIHHDNNHALNTLYLFVVVHVAGAHAPAILFRLLSLVSGVALLPVLFRSQYDAADPASWTRAWIATILCACSFLAILYSSEARGYAPVALFATVAYAQVRRGHIVSSRDRLTFAAACALGLLSHLTFVFAYAGLFVWTARSASRRKHLNWRSWIALHRFPVAFIAADYLLDARHLAYGGGPAFSTSEVVGRGLSVALGGPGAGAWAMVAAAYTISLIVVGLILTWREDGDEAIFFATALIIAPVAVLGVYRARFLEVRYFFVLLPFVWLLAARTLGVVLSSGGIGRAVAAALLIASIAGNAMHVAMSLRGGRGHYADAVSVMSAMTPSPDIVVAGDQDFSARLILEYYGERIAPGQRIIYVPASSGQRRDAQWYITHTYEAPAMVPPSMLTTAEGETYGWVGSFPYGGQSGFNWFLYKRQR
jgi:hypothetical protein